MERKDVMKYYIGLVLTVALGFFMYVHIGYDYVMHPTPVSLWWMLGLMVVLGAYAYIKLALLDQDREEVETYLKQEKEAREADAKKSEAAANDLQAAFAKKLEEHSAAEKKRLEKAQAENAALSELLATIRKAREILTAERALHQETVELALFHLGSTVANLRKWRETRVTSEDLKTLRKINLEIAFALFRGLKKFTWNNDRVPPSAVRDYVTELIREGQLDLSEPWVADLVRFIHGGERDEEAPVVETSATTG